jgi:hypothetical protein
MTSNTSNNGIQRETIVFSGSNEWTVEELTEFLGHLYVLYNRISVLREERSKAPARLSRQMYASKSRVPDDRKMFVESLTIHSPMEINLEGIAEIIREAREAIKDIYRNPLERKQLEQQLEHDATLNDIEIARSKLDLIREANQLMLEIGVSDEERRATLKALYDPASDAADIVEQKNLEIE